MKYDFVVIGATGMQGRIVTKSLAKKGYSVLMCGRDKSRVEHFLKEYKNTSFTYLDLNFIKDAIKIIKNSGAKVVVNCAEGDVDLNSLKACIKSGVHSIDLGSDIPMTKKQLGMNKVLKKKNLIHITGCGSVPGIGNIMLNYGSEKLEKIDTVEVGFAWDSNIKKFVVPFSIVSIIEEFTADAPYLQNHEIKQINPMKSIVKTYHRAIGREDEFKVGHHPETYTFHKFCEKKGIKNVAFYAGFPNHSMQTIQTLIDLGLGDEKEINVKGIKIRPKEFLTELLKNLGYPEGYKETENLWVFIEGKHKGKKKKIHMECIVLSLKAWEDAGCNIDTGIPAAIIAEMIYNGTIKNPGSYAPEDIVPPEPFFKELRKWNMRIYKNGKLIN